MAKFESAVIEGDKITLDKKELDSWIDHYMKISDSHYRHNWRKWYYFGKAAMLMDLKAHFNEEEIIE